MHSRDLLKLPIAAVPPKVGLIPVLIIAVLFGIAHVLTNGQYGFHRDELQFLSDAQHLDWGFVPYPPLTSALEHLELKAFGLSLVGLRMFSVLAQTVVILVSGLMARDLGGGRLAQVFTAIAVGLSPAPMANATMFQYSSFEKPGPSRHLCLRSFAQTVERALELRARIWVMRENLAEMVGALTWSCRRVDAPKLE